MGVGAGYEVVSADGVASAKAALEAGRDYCAVLCDRTLADGSGADLVRWSGSPLSRVPARRRKRTPGSKRWRAI